MAGCVAARRLAEDGNREVLVLERRGHIGGNCYDAPDEFGILVQKYGPHIFHTDYENVREYLSRFTRWRDFRHEVVAKVDSRLIPIPFNLNSLHIAFDEEKAARMERKLVGEYGLGSRVSVVKLRENEDSDIREAAEFVYRNIYLKYTAKQWGCPLEEVDSEVAARVPVVISRDNCYFRDKYQGVPSDGFTPMFERMLDHPNIELRLNADCADLIRLDGGKIFLQGEEFAGEVIYTGATDELFGYRFGRLPYRSLKFSFEHYGSDSFQGCSVVNYTVSEDYTRITEFKYLTGQKDTDGTTVAKEYPLAYSGSEGEIPYYAVVNGGSQALYGKYRALAGEYAALYLLGRLAEFKYYNMDQAALRAMELAGSIIDKSEKK